MVKVVLKKEDKDPELKTKVGALNMSAARPEPEYSPSGR